MYSAHRFCVLTVCALLAGGCVSSPNDYATGLEAAEPTVIGAETYAISLMPRMVLANAQLDRRRSIAAGREWRPASSQGALYQAYQRWLAGQVRPLSESASSVSQ